MTPLSTNQRVLTWLRVFPAERDASKWKLLAYKVTSMAVFIPLVINLLGSVAFIHKFISIDLGKCLFVLFQIALGGAMIYSMLAAFILRRRIVLVFENLSKIYNENEHLESFRFFAQANNQSEHLWKMYFKYMIGGYCFQTTLGSIISIFVCWWFKGHFDNNIVYRPMTLLFPWNQESMLSYIFDILVFHNIAAVSYFIASGSLILLFVSICLHHDAFFKRLQYTLRESKSTKNHQNMRQILRNVIEFHITVRDWFLETAQVYSLFVLVQMICTMVYMACIVYQLDLQFKRPDFTIIITMIALVVGTLNLFIYCYFGKLATESFEKMPHLLYEFNWQDLPVELQRHFVIMIRAMQKPILYHGFGIAVLNLQTFTNFVKAILSYYMAFKAMTE